MAGVTPSVFGQIFGKAGSFQQAAATCEPVHACLLLLAGALTPGDPCFFSHAWFGPAVTWNKARLMHVYMVYMKASCMMTQLLAGLSLVKAQGVTLSWLFSSRQQCLQHHGPTMLS